MNEIKCPNCGEVFQVDESGYAEILKSVRTKEFDKELKEREALILEREENKSALAAKDKDAEIERLKNELKSTKTETDMKIQLALAEKERELVSVKAEKERELESLKNELKGKQNEFEIEKNGLLQKHQIELEAKQEELDRVKDFKAHQSTKMLGETLEQHCENEFNRMRALAFQNAYFEKDNDARTGSKGDYIYREYDGEGTEIVSIMFEMKNEMETTATKKKNEDFFRELDKDRREKNCEYAVLVSMLEADSELYNAGIVDVSYKYEKMYVIRPQFFIPIITLLRNASMKSLDYKKQLIKAQEQHTDITNFENEMEAFKAKFEKNYRLASDNFGKAMDEIDTTIKHLEKIKEALRLTVQHFGHANSNAQDLSIKKLTKKSPMLREAFEEQKKNSEESL